MAQPQTTERVAAAPAPNANAQGATTANQDNARGAPLEPTGGSVLMLNEVRSAFNKFTGEVSNFVAVNAGYGDAETRAIRNLIREGARIGGKVHKGYYNFLPNGKGDRTPVSNQIVETARKAAIAVCAALLASLKKAGGVKATYTDKGREHKVDLKTGAITLPEEKSYEAWMEMAFSAPKGSQDGLSVLDDF